MSLAGRRPVPLLAEALSSASAYLARPSGHNARIEHLATPPVAQPPALVVVLPVRGGSGPPSDRERRVGPPEADEVIVGAGRQLRRRARSVSRLCDLNNAPGEQATPVAWSDELSPLFTEKEMGNAPTRAPSPTR